MRSQLRFAAASICVISLGVGAALAAARAAGTQLVLVKDGISCAPIVLFKDAPPYTRRAADELAGYIEKISGARPEVVEGCPDPVPDRAIWVGYQSKLVELFPEIDFNFRHPEEILIVATTNHVVIAGRDKWDPEHLIVETPRGKIEGKQLEYGTVNAVYTFLQDKLGVRWLWPGELGEDIIEQKTIALAPFEYRYHPQIRQRGGLFRLSALGDNRGLAFDWTRFQRLQLDSLDVQAGHAFGDWWEKYHETHPDFMALQPDGTRSGFPAPTEPGKAKICQANPAVWEQWLANAADAMSNNVYQTCFSASPNDSYNRGHCICEKCRAWDHPDGELLIYVWQGISQEYVSLSDRQVTFANTLARLLKERYPDKPYFVGMHAYGHYRAAPIAVVPDDNVIISSVANFFLRDPAGRAEHMGQFADWGKVAPHLMWRPNTGSPAGWQQGLPDVPFHEIMEDFKFIADNHCVGLNFDTVWEYWLNQGPLYYLMAQLAWNPCAEGEATMDDYYQRAYGPAADDLTAYWKLMEESRNRKVNEGMDYEAVYDAAFFDRAYGLLDQATKKAANAPEKYSQRIAFTRTGLDFTRLVTDTRALMARYRDSRGQDQAVADQARANWDALNKIINDQQNLMNHRYFRPGGRYTMGLHPDDKPRK